MDELTRRRLEHNEQLFRSINEEIDDRPGGIAELDYVCECADTACTETVRLTHREYEGVRAGRDHYLVLPEHVVPALERVVERHAGWVVVEKL